jgi:elongation factor P hydroxylase
MSLPQCSPTGTGALIARHDIRDLVRIFDSQFVDSENTCLVTGAEEPLYQPAQSRAERHRIYCRADYYASALHEVAHWCLAGPSRRARVDYGYWYHPDGRDVRQQREFENVEARPQGLECLFALAADYRFCLSFDNLGGSPPDRGRFAELVRGEMQKLCARMPPRAACFREALCRFYQRPADLPTADQLAALSW